MESSESSTNGICVVRIVEEVACLMAVVNSPRGFSRIKACKAGILSSAWTGRMYIFANHFRGGLILGYSFEWSPDVTMDLPYIYNKDMLSNCNNMIS